MNFTTRIAMHDGTVDRIRLNTLYIRKENDHWSLLIMRKIPLTEKSKHSYTKLVPAIYEYWWRPQDHSTDSNSNRNTVNPRLGHVDWKCHGFPPSISGEFFRFGTSLALGVWSLKFMKSWRDNSDLDKSPLKRRYRGRSTRKIPKMSRTEGDIDPQPDWVLDVVYELDEKWFRRNDFISQATALTRWMCGNYLTEYITSSNLRWP